MQYNGYADHMAVVAAAVRADLEGCLQVMPPFKASCWAGARAAAQREQRGYGPHQAAAVSIAFSLSLMLHLCYNAAYQSRLTS